MICQTDLWVGSHAHEIHVERGDGRHHGIWETADRTTGGSTADDFERSEKSLQTALPGRKQNKIARGADWVLIVMSFKGVKHISVKHSK